LQSVGDGRFQYTVGAFLQSNEHKYLQQWIQPGLSPTLSVDRPNSTDIYFRTDQVRELDQTAIFGELSFDLSDTVTATVGARWFDEEANLQGVVGWGPSWQDGYADVDLLDTVVDLKDSNSDTILKANVAWDVSDSAMIYATWSEGYRPGGINRDPALLVTAGTQIWVPDFLTNLEFGWKATLADGRVRLNGAVYKMDWDDIQYTVYDGSLSFCCGSTYNLATAEITGVEVDLTAQVTDAFTLSVSAAFNDAETTADFILPSDQLSVPKGTSLPNVPEFKGSIVGRFEFEMAGSDAYAQVAYSYTGDSISEITQPDTRNRFDFDRGVWDQDAYSILNFRVGMNKGDWGADLFVNNMTNEVAQYYRHPRPYAPSTVTNRPRSTGVGLWMRF
jgi:outer membrane receptor protein involved in Fe transport